MAITGTKEWADEKNNCILGCCNNCVYCVGGDTLILMGDGRSKPIKEICIGDEIIGCIDKTPFRKLTKTKVIAKYCVNKPKYIIKLKNGITLTCSPDHRWMTDRGWKYTTNTDIGIDRAHLTQNNKLSFVGYLQEPIEETDDYKQGYLSGIIRGDGLLKTFKDSRRPPTVLQYQFRLALKDTCATERSYNYLKEFGVICNLFRFKISDKHKMHVNAIRTNSKANFEKIKEVISFKETSEYYRGFLSGIFDAEGNGTPVTPNKPISVLRIVNSDSSILTHIEKSLNHFKFKYVYDVDHKVKNTKVRSIRVMGGLPEFIRFRQLTDISIERKLDITGVSIKTVNTNAFVETIIPSGETEEMYDITTGTGNFIANGVLSHNCYAKSIGIRTGHTTEELWKTERPNKNARPKKHKGLLMFPTSHDLHYKTIGMWGAHLDALIRLDNRILIVSKPEWDAMSYIIDHYKDTAYKQNIEFRYTIGTDDEETRKFWEPGAPMMTERIRCLRYAYQCGFKTSTSMEPLLVKDPVSFINKIDPYVTGEIWIGIMNYLKKEWFTDNTIEWYHKQQEINSRENILKVYNATKSNPKIRYKDSARDLLGLK